jgi:NAD(P)-dependent dehydrogenase (short-subunit alcohol dehydrogenase family)
MSTTVLVVIGAGGMGATIAQRIGSGRTLLLADASPERLHTSAQTLTANGHTVLSAGVDVASQGSVADLAQYGASVGPITGVVHTAGVSPEQADISTILKVDLLGVATVLEQFGQVIQAGGAGVVISSMAGHLHPAIDPGIEQQLATAPARDLLALQACSPIRFVNSQHSYAFAKRANHLRVAAAASSWGTRGARINSISPGVISTSMGKGELDGGSGLVIQNLIDASAAGRIGTPDDIAAAADFLLSPAAAYITGTDLLVDGGITAAVKTATYS